MANEKPRRSRVRRHGHAKIAVCQPVRVQTTERGMLAGFLRHRIPPADVLLPYLILPLGLCGHCTTIRQQSTKCTIHVIWTSTSPGSGSVKTTVNTVQRHAVIFWATAVPVLCVMFLLQSLCRHQGNFLSLSGVQSQRASVHLPLSVFVFTFQAVVTGPFDTSNDTAAALWRWKRLWDSKEHHHSILDQHNVTIAPRK
jgi:hypothetical protein